MHWSPNLSYKVFSWCKKKSGILMILKMRTIFVFGTATSVENDNLFRIAEKKIGKENISALVSHQTISCTFHSEK